MAADSGKVRSEQRGKVDNWKVLMKRIVTTGIFSADTKTYAYQDFQPVRSTPHRPHAVYALWCATLTHLESEWKNEKTWTSSVELSGRMRARPLPRSAI